MLDFLRGKVGNRKLWLYAVACCQRTAHLYPTEGRRTSLSVLERWAEGLATIEEVGAAIRTALEGWEPEREREIIVRELVADTLLAFFDHPSDAFEVAWVASFRSSDAVRMSERNDQGVATVESRQQASLLREIMGNPFRHVAVDPSWLAWNGGTVGKFAQAIYDERAFNRLPLLAEAFEEAGCHDPDPLAHCRQPGEHVRGCWVLDLLLGKE